MLLSIALSFALGKALTVSGLARTLILALTLTRTLTRTRTPHPYPAPRLAT